MVSGRPGVAAWPRVLRPVHQTFAPAEARVREQASLLDIAHDAISVRDLDDRILYWNQGAERLYGWTAAEVVGQNAGQLLYKGPAPALAEARPSGGR